MPETSFEFRFHIIGLKIRSVVEQNLSLKVELDYKLQTVPFGWLISPFMFTSANSSKFHNPLLSRADVNVTVQHREQRH